MRGKDSETTETRRSFVWLAGTLRNSSWGSARWINWYTQEVRQRARQEVLCQTKEHAESCWASICSHCSLRQSKSAEKPSPCVTSAPPHSLWGFSSSEASGFCTCKIEVKLFSLLSQPMVVGMWSCCELFGALEFWRHILCLGIPASPHPNSSKLAKKKNMQCDNWGTTERSSFGYQQVAKH